MMESFHDFEPEDPNTKLPTSLDLIQIKQTLLRGERNQILLSIEKIKTYLDAEISLCQILRSDILEFLWDAVLPFDSVVACALYQCIEIMAGHAEFFIHNHSFFAIESLMRTLHFLVKDCDNFKGLNQCLNILNLILQGYKSHCVTPERKTVEILLQVLSILKNLAPTVNNKYQTGAFILNLIELDIIKQSQEAYDSILASVSSWFNLMNEILEAEHPLREKLILLCCTLCHSALRYLISNESSTKEFTFEINDSSRSDIIKNINLFLITVGTPYFDHVARSQPSVLILIYISCKTKGGLLLFFSIYFQTMPLKELEKKSSYLENFYQTILWFYTDEITSEKNGFIHGLNGTGFLQFTTKVLFLVDLSQGQKLHRLCVLALFYMILYLAEEVFYFPEVWPSGRDNFRCEVLRGVAELPSNVTRWPDVLVSPHASFSSKLAFLLYLYFYSMTSKSQDMLQALYPVIINYIRTDTEIGSSILLLKVVWFVFVMSQLSVAQNSSLEVEVDDVNNIVALLETQADLSLVYTHHPALLYWAFSSKVSSNVQTQTVHLWLRNKTPDCKELDELMKNSSDVKYAILDILQNGWGSELDSAFSSLKSLLLDSDTDDDLPGSIWFLLPQVLAKFTADFTSAINVDYVIELSSLRTPKSLDSAKLIRIASLLPEVLLMSDLISVVPSLSLVLQLARLGRQLEDCRVLWVFLRHDGFVQKIIEGLNTNVSEIFILSIKIMVVLWKECRNTKNTECLKIEIKSEDILRMLNTNCDQVLSEGLNFCEEILISNFQSPIFKIQGIDYGFLELLFVEILNASIKTTFDNCKRCWRSVKLLLSMEHLSSELISNPLFHELVIGNLGHLQKSQELQELLLVWIDFYNARVNDPCFGRKIFGVFYSETVTKIRRKLMEGEKQEDQTLFEKVVKSGFVWVEKAAFPE